MWPLKVRVGANSPSLWPTIDSVMNTGTCLRPSCTAIVCPSMSGMIVERRDQVLMTALELLSLATSTFLSRWSSMNGPFLRLRGISCPPAQFSVCVLFDLTKVIASCRPYDDDERSTCHWPCSAGG